MEILGAMLRKALSHNNFPYALYILQLTSEVGLRPTQKFMDFLETSEKKMADLFRRKVHDCNSILVCLRNSRAILHNYYSIAETERFENTAIFTRS